MHVLFDGLSPILIAALSSRFALLPFVLQADLLGNEI